MSKAVYGLVAAAGSISAVVWGISGLSGEKIRGGTFVGSVYVGNLSPAAAKVRLVSWWDQERLQDRQFTGCGNVVQSSLDSLNVKFDPAATLDGAPRAPMFNVPGSDPIPVRIEPVLNFDAESLQKLKMRLDGAKPDFSPARVVLVGDAIKRSAEAPRMSVDADALPGAIRRQLGSAIVQAPTRAEAKHVGDDVLDSIKEVISTYSTRFPTSKKSRCSNIQLAALKLNGTVLLPGERVSFNETVGRRTQKNGFKIAGVYRNGKHDFDVGGGICQVSTTLYNAALLANLKIVSRHNHSMPVAYVPLGRDATVDYGVLDLVLENNTGRPIAISSEYQPGRLKFHVLGIKEPGLIIKIQSEGRRNWVVGTKTIADATLAGGSKKVVEKGSNGHSISTFRLVLKNGKLVNREALGQSFYRGGQRIIAVGPAVRPEVAPALPAQA